jgi:hypothetical protein
MFEEKINQTLETGVLQVQDLENKTGTTRTDPELSLDHSTSFFQSQGSSFYLEEKIELNGDHFKPTIIETPKIHQIKIKRGEVVTRFEDMSVRQKISKFTKSEDPRKPDYIDLNELDNYTSIEGDCQLCNRRYHNR